MTAKNAAFPKQHRLLQRQEFTRLTGSNKSISGRFFLIIWDINILGYPRIGITASKKTGSSVRRNRLKRCIREFFRQHHSLLPDVDFNVIVRRQAADISAAILNQELQRAFQQIGSRTCCHESS